MAFDLQTCEICGAAVITATGDIANGGLLEFKMKQTGSMDRHLEWHEKLTQAVMQADTGMGFMFGRGVQL